MKNPNKIIMGSAIGLAVIAVAIDHTRHRLPEPQAQLQPGGEATSNYEIIETPCSMQSPCALNENPCSLTSSPCGLRSE